MTTLQEAIAKQWPDKFNPPDELHVHVFICGWNAALAALAQERNKENVLTCVYCGHEYPPGSPTHGAEVLTEHIKTCPKHPLSEYRESLEETTSLLRAFAGHVQDGIADVVLAKATKLLRRKP